MSLPAPCFVLARALLQLCHGQLRSHGPHEFSTPSTQPTLASSAAPVGSELTLLSNMIFVATDAHRTSRLDSAHPSTRRSLMTGSLHSLGFPGEKCLGGPCCLQPHSLESISCTASKHRAL